MDMDTKISIAIYKIDSNFVILSFFIVNFMKAKKNIQIKKINGQAVAFLNVTYIFVNFYFETDSISGSHFFWSLKTTTRQGMRTSQGKKNTTCLNVKK